MNGRNRVQPYRRLREENRQPRQQLEFKDRQLCELMEENAELLKKVHLQSDEIKVLKKLPKTAAAEAKKTSYLLSSQKELLHSVCR